jgi:hypothetical protein
MDFVRAVQHASGNQNDILVFLKVTPTVKDFKLIMSMKITYEMGQGTKIIDIQKQKEDNVRSAVYGKDLKEKNPKMYDLVKDKVNLNTSEELYFIVFNFYSLTKAEIDSMTLKYGLWESDNPDVRNEKTFNFKVEGVD